MRRAPWLLLCLIALEGICCCLEWKDSLTLVGLHRDAIELHQRALADSSPAEARSLDEQSWTLIEAGQAVRRSRITWQVLSIGLMVVLLAVGFWSFNVSQHETRRRSQAETNLRREQISLENRIESRTAQLRAEVEERRKAEDRNRHQKRVLELLANNAPLEEIFAELTASVAVQRRSWESAVHLVDATKESLQLIASSEVSERLEHYLSTIAVGFPDAPESTAWTSGAPCFIGSMIEQHRPWSEFLISNAIRAAWSLPLLLGDGNCVGTLTVYSRLFGIPNEQDRELLDTAVRLATLVVDVRRMNSQLQRKAFEDELTGVANRRAGEIRLQEAMIDAHRRNQSLAILLIDLDRFKRVNDLYGHTHGDQVLLQVARRISAHRCVNGAVARMGGDEFLVLLESCPSEDEALQTAAELASRINEPILLGRETATVGASIGITMFPRDGETLDELERHADAAMYQAKRRSIGWCAFSPAIRKEVDWAISVEEGLRAALDPRAGRELLDVHYQPILDLHGQLIAFEALLRFRHPELGPVSPAQFIPIAEGTKLIIPLGQRVLRKVCLQIVAWRQAGLAPVRIGVNISAVQWGRADFVEEVRGILAETGVPPATLTLELTESVVMQNAQQAQAHMRALKEVGIQIAMDDFGTGYSSLSYLHQLPIDIIKIDRSFVARLGQADDSRSIVESVISMAHLLGMTTIAEGVETEHQRNLLTAMGCDALQGFLFAHPMPAGEAASWVRDDVPAQDALPAALPVQDSVPPPAPAKELLVIR